MATFNIRLGADIGGTFTDVVLEVGQDQYSTKVLTTYAAPEDAIVEGLQQVCQKAQIQPSQIEQIIHGTTLATNALIERRGAKTALITTQGFRDVIEMRTESRFEQYDLNLELPEALIPRERRYTLHERIDARGQILRPLERDEILALTEKIQKAKFESVAVGFLHAYKNSAHEEKIRDILVEKIPGLMVSISSEVSPQMREYERFNTVVANAYVKPLMKSYLLRLRERLKSIDVTCNVFLMHSGGGIISIESAAEFPVRLIESGPAGGAVFAAHIADRYNLDKVLSFDMGGTTAKICLIKNKTPKTSRVFEVARTYRFKKGSGMPISIPVIDMVEIGAGGGSIAHVDELQQIRVGPQSAGSEPGPACYDRGGDQPAVTDADLILGKLDPNNFAGGSIPLNTQAASKALLEIIGKPLAMDATTAAYGVSEVVDENMANAARVHAVENGEDLSHYTMIAFGGAAPLHAARLCEKLGVERCLVPPGAGVGSAIGFLRAPFSFEATRSHFMAMDAFDPSFIKKIFSDLKTEAVQFVRDCDPSVDIISDYKVYMRYKGQGWEIPIVLKQEDIHKPNVDYFKNTFEYEYQSLFGRSVEGVSIEITGWAVNATTPTKKTNPVQVNTKIRDAVIGGDRILFDAALREACPAQLVERKTMNTGDGINGPALIIEDETTIIVPTSRNAVAQEDGCIDLMPQAIDTNRGAA